MGKRAAATCRIWFSKCKSFCRMSTVYGYGSGWLIARTAVKSSSFSMCGSFPLHKVAFDFMGALVRDFAFQPGLRKIGEPQAILRFEMAEDFVAGAKNRCG